MKEMLRVLFICIHNSGRSVMAEAFLKDLGGEDRFEVASAGLEPRPVNPLVVEAMEELGYDVSGHKPSSVMEFFKAGRLYDFVITVCDEAIEEKCPVFPGVAKRLHWPFRDPAGLPGTHEEKMAGIRKIRDSILSWIEVWLEDLDLSRAG